MAMGEGRVPPMSVVSLPGRSTAVMVDCETTLNHMIEPLVGYMNAMLSVMSKPFHGPEWPLYSPSLIAHVRFKSY